MNVNEVQKLYTKRAYLYHRLFVDFFRWGKKLERFFQKSDYLRPNLKILDAGCGTGIVTRVLYDIAREKGYEGITFHGFDITPAMLDIFREWIAKKRAKGISLEQADVLNLKNLPPNWKEYDLIVSSGMLEYLPKDKMRQALNNLRQLLKKDGRLLVFITRRNVATKLLVELWWKANIYDEKEIKQIFQEIGFSELKYTSFAEKWLNSTIIVEAKR